MTTFQKLAIASVVATFGLIVLGGVVRATKSGLGCPDWPQCHGRFVPPGHTEALIEFSHRFVAGGVSILVLAVAIMAWKRYRDDKAIIIPAIASLGVIGVQIVLGMVTVVRELPPEVVAAHLSTALIFFGCMLMLTVATFRDRLPRVDLAQAGAAVKRAVPLLGLFVLALTIAVMAFGAYMTESGANYACTTWPDCNGSFLPDGGRLVQIHWFHRLLAASLGFGVIAVVIQVFRSQTSTSFMRKLALGMLALFAAQVVVGAANIWTEIAAWVTIIHLGMGSLFWASLVCLTGLSYYVGQVQAVEPARSRQETPSLTRFPNT